MFLKTPKWLSKEKYSNEKALERDLDELRCPYVVCIGKLSNASDSDYGLTDHAWEADDDGGYRCKILFTEHRKGYIWRPEESIRVPSEGDETNDLNLIIPKVKTYCKVVGTDAEYEEVYDSTTIDVNSGDVIIRSSSNEPSYLVVIY